MRITKLGHCCLVIEEAGLRILTDPGNYSTTQNQVEDIDVILITHEHPDHVHLDSLKVVLQNNPKAKIFTNRGVGKILNEQKVSYTLLEHGQSTKVGDVSIEAFGQKHHLIYSSLPLVENTGYFIANRFFYPGDAFTVPGRPVGVLALPVNAPWLALAEAVDYAKTVSPRQCFPVHDGNMKRLDTIHRLFPKLLEPEGIKFVPLTEDGVLEI